MTEELRKLQGLSGAVFADSDSEIQVPVSYGNDQGAIASAYQGMALCDRSDWGLIQVSGDDRLRFLHNQSTNEFQKLQPGQGCDTVFVTSTARTIDLATAYMTEDTTLLVVSPSRRQRIMEWLDRYLFPADRVELQDITNSMAMFSLMGPESLALLAPWGVAGDWPHASHQLLTLGEIQVRVAVGSGLALPGYTLICNGNDAASLWKLLTDGGAVPLGSQGWEQLRIQQGRPAPDCELTEDYNPLEAGLWHNISFDKGCYIGQETIARLNTYKGVKVQLWGVKLNAPASPGTVVTMGEEKVGTLTSYTNTPEGPFGLAYIRTKAGGAGLQVQVGEVTGEVVDIPFVTRGYLG
ncbi:CAF17-like 4Fe-4S cluster assembly/insertion protein YgfZ [Laspinema olomoucense]|uniref:Folate-binding protein n=1 Tax=Laspinema olomoucense D3b TaxID=2953688 RepID=A0ABT2N0K0_9CYAN|nr:folate-binding protein [Laspinema sp. D3b]MCT7976112.1 folate-binding protein [Laspinema sp. D3b]